MSSRTEVRDVLAPQGLEVGTETDFSAAVHLHLHQLWPFTIINGRKVIRTFSPKKVDRFPIQLGEHDLKRRRRVRHLQPPQASSVANKQGGGDDDDEEEEAVERTGISNSKSNSYLTISYIYLGRPDSHQHEQYEKKARRDGTSICPSTW